MTAALPFLAQLAFQTLDHLPHPPLANNSLTIYEDRSPYTPPVVLDGVLEQGQEACLLGAKASG